MICWRQPWRLATLIRSRPLSIQAKSISTSNGDGRRLDPSVLLTESMTGTLPKFEVEGENISILATPADFYKTLLAMITRAKRRIHISSLYIGETESQLLDTLSKALASNGQLELIIQVDALRSTRPTTTQTSPAHLLLPLIAAYPERVKVHLFRSPKLNGLLRHVVPRRFDEGWGTWHAKAYLVDDEVVLSGANLSTSYFTDRQDRYVHITSAPQFTNYLVELLQVFSNYSSLLELDVGTSLGYKLCWIHEKSIFDFTDSAKADIASLQASERNRTTSTHSASRPVIMPMVQSGVLGIREEEEALHTVFSLVDNSTTSAPLVDLTSGYFALYGPYQDRVLASKANYRIVAASPEANGFLGSKGLSGRIPAGYTLLERRFWERVLIAQRQWEGTRGIQLSEWKRPGWTYHAKGIWITAHPSEAPYASLFGSTNLNSRSAHLDTEVSFLLSVPKHESALRSALRDEIVNIRRDTGPVDSHTFALPERHVSLTTRAIVGLVGSML